MNIKSIGTSWIIALLLLGLFSLVNQPTKVDPDATNSLQTKPLQAKPGALSADHQNADEALPQYNRETRAQSPADPATTFPATAYLFSQA